MFVRYFFWLSRAPLESQMARQSRPADPHLQQPEPQFILSTSRTDRRFQQNSPCISDLKAWVLRRQDSDKENSGHHHLLVDTELPPLDQPIPNDFNHLHFGAGQTETEVTLAPGDHTLQLFWATGTMFPIRCR